MAAADSVEGLNESRLSQLLFRIEAELACVGTERIVLLRNFEGLPFRNPGKDIDIIVSTTAMPLWEMALKAAAAGLGLALEKTASDYYFASYVFTSTEADRFSLKIDLNFEFQWRGVRFGSTDTIVKTAIPYASPIFVARSTTERALITFFHSFLYGGTIQAKYLPLFQRELHLNRHEFTLRFCEVFGVRDAALLERLISQGISSIKRSDANGIRLRAILRAFVRAPIRTTRGFVASLWIDAPSAI